MIDGSDLISILLKWDPNIFQWPLHKVPVDPLLISTKIVLLYFCI